MIFEPAGGVRVGVCKRDASQRSSAPFSESHRANNVTDSRARPRAALLSREATKPKVEAPCSCSARPRLTRCSRIISRGYISAVRAAPGAKRALFPRGQGFAVPLESSHLFLIAHGGAVACKLFDQTAEGGAVEYRRTDIVSRWFLVRFLAVR